MPSDETLDAIARIDLVESQGPQATPVDYQRGTVPDTPEQSYEPERVQLCLQGLLLRANGYQCREGILYFAAAKRRVTIPFTDALVQRTTELLNQSREMAGRGAIPPPLEDSPKCPRCSLVGICLPDEVTFLQGSRRVAHPDDVRLLTPARDDALPVYVLTRGAVVGKSGNNLTISAQRRPIADTRLLDVSGLPVFGNVSITAQATRELLDRGITVCHFTYGGWLKGVTASMSHKNVELRIAQFRTAAAPTMSTLLGLEGAAARVYFAHFGDLLKTGNAPFDFRSRNRRPPKDPVNAVLSFLYSMLIRQAMAASLATGFDPYMGFYHRPKYGRPALALDPKPVPRRPVPTGDCARLIRRRSAGRHHRHHFSQTGRSSRRPRPKPTATPHAANLPPQLRRQRSSQPHRWPPPSLSTERDQTPRTETAPCKVG